MPNDSNAKDHLPECTETECAEGCPVQAERDAEYAAGHEWHADPNDARH